MSTWIPDFLNNWSYFVQNALYPPCCVLCDAPGAPGLDLCPACRQSLPRVRHPCPVCGIEMHHQSQAPCGTCQKKPPHFTRLDSLFAYQDSARFLIHGLKYRRQMSHARVLGLLLSQRMIQIPERPQAIIPVPLHHQRLLSRGFNQSQEIARHVSTRLRIPLDPFRCWRIRATPSQSDLNAKQRRQNVKNAFDCQAVKDFQHVAVLDDVVTTGATVNEVARTLKRAGVQRVDVWACARA